MPDSWLITGNLGWGTASPGATTLELASYAIADEGIDFDFGSLFQNTYIQSPMTDGGRVGFQQNGIRRFKFPLRLASSWPGPGGLSGLAEYLRRIVKVPAHPSAGFIDLLPQNASYPIRFDIIDGRLDLRQYNVHRQRIARHDYDLTLDVQPFGYLPTTILLASAAGASGNYIRLSWNPGSIIGDAPGLGQIGIAASTGASSAPAALVLPQTDGLYWSLSRQPGGTVLWSPSMIIAATAGQGTSMLGATHLADALSPMGMALNVNWSATSMASQSSFNGPAGFQLLTFAHFDDAPAYRGRFRAVAFLRTNPSHAVPWQVTSDEVLINGLGADALPPLASQHPIATLLSQAASLAASGHGPGSYFQCLDLGEHVFPPVAASGGNSLQTSFRIWVGCGTTNMGIPSPAIVCGGIALIPVGGDAGVLPMGIVWPSSGGGAYYNSTNQFVHDGIDRRTFNGILFFPDTTPGGFAAESGMVADLRSIHLGAYPGISTAASLDVLTFARELNPRLSSLNPSPHDVKIVPAGMSAGASFSYRPRFSFLRGL